MVNKSSMVLKPSTSPQATHELNNKNEQSQEL